MISKEEIKELIGKNKKTLLDELTKSKELISLLGKSTHTKLTDLEKEKVKVQLLDICKGIPAFTIFMLPGGIILLPIMAKLIPDLFPSVFKKEKKE